MKTKLIILMAAAAAVFYSCSNDRDENVAPIEKTNKPELKLNKFDLDVKGEESAFKDSLSIPKNTSGINVLTPAPENGEEPIVDPTKPDKPW